MKRRKGKFLYLLVDFYIILYKMRMSKNNATFRFIEYLINFNTFCSRVPRRTKREPTDRQPYQDIFLPHNDHGMDWRGLYGQPWDHNYIV